MKITGNEPYHPIVAENGKPSGISTGVTIYQQMVIEFVKSIVNGTYINHNMTLKIQEMAKQEGILAVDITAQMATEYAKAVIKQLNEENPTEPVKPSILAGKVAIRVDSEREFKLLMEHYESKHFISGTGNNDIKPVYPVIVPYEQSFWCRYYEDHCRTHSIIPFADFASEVGITAPKFIMRSEDDVDLYEGDEFYHVHFTTGTTGWKENISNPVKKYQETGVLTRGHINKAFSTREAAEKWIEEQNRPKEIKLTDQDGQTYAIINGNGFIAHINRYNSYQLEEIYNAYQSLKSDETVNDN